MKVKALCGIIYNGKMYKSGDVFEAANVIEDTVAVNDESLDHLEPDKELMIPDLGIGKTAVREYAEKRGGRKR